MRGADKRRDRVYPGPMLAGYGHLLRAADRLRWDEAELDLAGDADAWPKLPKYLRVPLARLLAGFCVAENAVAEHLEPFAAGTDDLELRACFAAQADDERRHARFFDRVLAEVLGVDPEHEAHALAGAGVVELFEQTLPAKARDLAEGRCDLSQAVTLYHLVLEGVVFSVGQTAALELLDEAPPCPGPARAWSTCRPTSAGTWGWACAACRTRACATTSWRRRWPRRAAPPARGRPTGSGPPTWPTRWSSTAGGWRRRAGAHGVPASPSAP